MALRGRMQAQEAERARVAQDAEEKLMLRRKRGVTRNSRDAYFHGLVFAAYANDEQGIVDNEEKAWLTEIGGLCQFGQAEVERIIAKVGSLGDADKLSLIEECVRDLQDPEAVASFLGEFGEVWRIGGGSQEDLDGFRDDFEKWLSPDLINGAKSICTTPFTPVSRPEATDQSDAVKCEAESSSSSEEREEAPSDLPSLRKIICIVGQRVKVDRVIEFGLGEEVEFENSELVFDEKGSIKVNDASMKFTKCRVSVCETTDELEPAQNFAHFLITGQGRGVLEFDGCDFSGGKNVLAIDWLYGGTVNVESCIFHDFTAERSSVVQVGTLNCRNSVFSNCSMNPLIYAEDFSLSQCVFVRCRAGELLCYESSEGNRAEVRDCKFKDCSCYSVLEAHSDIFGEECDGFFGCCFVNVNYRASEPRPLRASFNVDVQESVFDANWLKWTGVPMREVEQAMLHKSSAGAPGISGEIQPMSSLFPSVVIRNRRVRIDDVLCIAPDTELVIENSELVFGCKGLLKIATNKVSIRNAVFSMESDCDPAAQFVPDWFVLATGKCADSVLKFSRCEFRGDGKRGAVSCDGALTFQDCTFENLWHNQKSMIKARSVDTLRCRFANCRGEGMSSLILADDVILHRTIIEGCKTEFKMFQWGGAGHHFEVRESKLKNCKVTQNLLGTPAGSRTGFVAPFGFFSCCFVDVKFKGGFALAYEDMLTKQTDMTEEEYDSRFQCFQS